MSDINSAVLPEREWNFEWLEGCVHGVWYGVISNIKLLTVCESAIKKFHYYIGDTMGSREFPTADAAKAAAEQAFKNLVRGEKA